MKRSNRLLYILTLLLAVGIPTVSCAEQRSFSQLVDQNVIKLQEQVKHIEEQAWKGIHRDGIQDLTLWGQLLGLFSQPHVWHAFQNSLRNSVSSMIFLSADQKTARRRELLATEESSSTAKDEEKDDDDGDGDDDDDGEDKTTGDIGSNNDKATEKPKPDSASSGATPSSSSTLIPTSTSSTGNTKDTSKEDTKINDSPSDKVDEKKSTGTKEKSDSTTTTPIAKSTASPSFSATAAVSDKSNNKDSSNDAASDTPAITTATTHSPSFAATTAVKKESSSDATSKDKSDTDAAPDTATTTTKTDKKPTQAPSSSTATSNGATSDTTKEKIGDSKNNSGDSDTKVEILDPDTAFGTNDSKSTGTKPTAKTTSKPPTVSSSSMPSKASSEDATTKAPTKQDSEKSAAPVIKQPDTSASRQPTAIKPKQGEVPLFDDKKVVIVTKSPTVPSEKSGSTDPQKPKNGADSHDKTIPLLNPASPTLMPTVTFAKETNTVAPSVLVTAEKTTSSKDSATADDKEVAVESKPPTIQLTTQPSVDAIESTASPSAVKADDSKPLAPTPAADTKPVSVPSSSSKPSASSKEGDGGVEFLDDSPTLTPTHKVKKHTRAPTSTSAEDTKDTTPKTPETTDERKDETKEQPSPPSLEPTAIPKAASPSEKPVQQPVEVPANSEPTGGPPTRRRRTRRPSPAADEIPPTSSTNINKPTGGDTKPKEENEEEPAKQVEPTLAPVEVKKTHKPTLSPTSEAVVPKEPVNPEPKDGKSQTGDDQNNETADSGLTSTLDFSSFIMMAVVLGFVFFLYRQFCSSPAAPGSSGNYARVNAQDDTSNDIELARSLQAQYNEGNDWEDWEDPIETGNKVETKPVAKPEVQSKSPPLPGGMDVASNKPTRSTTPTATKTPLPPIKPIPSPASTTKMKTPSNNSLERDFEDFLSLDASGNISVSSPPPAAVIAQSFSTITSPPSSSSGFNTTTNNSKKNTMNSGSKKVIPTLAPPRNDDDLFASIGIAAAPKMKGSNLPDLDAMFNKPNNHKPSSSSTSSSFNKPVSSIKSKLSVEEDNSPFASKWDEDKELDDLIGDD